MSLQTWRQLLEAIKAFHHLQTARHRNPATKLVLHGGEPLALPLPYLKEVLSLCHEILGSEMERNVLRIGMQTNLYRLTDEMISLIKHHDIDVGVSCDVVPGVRVSVTGKETESSVLRNMERLISHGIKVGAITVLAKHTSQRICEVYDFYAERHIPWRVLPLFDGPETRAIDKFATSYDELILALQKLFVYWFETGIRIPVAPFMEHFENTLRKMAGIQGRLYNRRIDGDGVFVVNHDGNLFRVLDGYEPSLAMGNVGQQTIEEILSSQAYAASLDRDDHHREQYCKHCKYQGACNGWPIFASRQSGSFQGRCPLSYRIHQFMEQYLREHGYDEAKIQAMFLSLLKEKSMHPSILEQTVTL